MVPAVRSLYTVTCFFWPILHARSRAYSREKKEKKKGKLLSCVRLFATPRTVAYQAPLSVGFSRQEYWSGFPFPSPGYSREMRLNKGPSQQQALTNSQSLPSTPQIRTLANEAKYTHGLLRKTNRQATKQTKPALPEKQQCQVSSHVLSSPTSGVDAPGKLRRPSLQAEDKTQPGCELYAEANMAWGDAPECKPPDSMSPTQSFKKINRPVCLCLGSSRDHR